MYDKPTYELEKKLNGMKTSELDKFLKDNSNDMVNGKAFYYYMKDTIESKNMRLKDVYIAAGVSDSYGGQIIRMEKNTKNRDLIIRLCIASHFMVNEISKALKLYGMNPLYAKDKRDVCIMVAINNRKYDLLELDDLLENQGFEKLLVEE